MNSSIKFNLFLKNIKGNKLGGRSWKKQKRKEGDQDRVEKGRKTEKGRNENFFKARGKGRVQGKI